MSAVCYVEYDADGNITAVFRGSTATIGEPSGLFIEYTGELDITPGQHFVASGEVEEKTLLDVSWDTTTITADGVDEAILTTLPNPCTVYVDGDPVVVTDGSFEFAANNPGVYRVSVEESAYLWQEWDIEAS